MFIGKQGVGTAPGANTILWGLDPSTNTGLIVMNGDGTVRHACNIQHDPRDKPTKEQKAAKGKGTIRHPIERAQLFQGSLRSIMLDYGRPQLVVLEDYGFTPKQGTDTIITQCYVGFAIRAFLLQEGIPYIEIPPTTLKKYVGANRKEEVMMKVFVRWSHQAATNDQADAYVLAKIAQHAMGLGAPTSADVAALSKLKDDETLCQFVPRALLAGLKLAA